MRIRSADAIPQSPDARRGADAIRTFGEHEGFGLAFMIELLAATLANSGTAGPAGGRTLGNGMLSTDNRPGRAGQPALDRARDRRPSQGLSAQPADKRNGRKNRFHDHSQHNGFIRRFVETYNHTRLKAVGYIGPVEALANHAKHRAAGEASGAAAPSNARRDYLRAGGGSRARGR